MLIIFLLVVTVVYLHYNGVNSLVCTLVILL